MAIREQISVICDAFVRGLRSVLGNTLYGAYVYGAAAFPEDTPTGDIDFHVVLTTELTQAERSELEDLHHDLAREFPPLGGELDGYYILLADARSKSPPRSQMWSRATDASWALHRAHILAGRHIVLHGPDPAGIYPPASWQELERALCGELHYVEQHLHRYPDYCILNLCRLIYSFETKDVVISKAAASEWAREALPEWQQPIDVARGTYPGGATARDREFMLTEVGRFYRYARLRIQQTDRGSAGSGHEAHFEATAKGAHAAGGSC